MSVAPQKTTPAPTGSTGRRLIKPESRRQSGPVVSDATDSKPKSKSKSEPARRSDRAARASQPSGASSRAAIKRTDEVATELRHWHVELLLNDETHGADVVLVGLRAGESELWYVGLFAH